MKQSNTELDQLKQLLLSDELALLKTLVSKVEHLEFETFDESAVKTKLIPLFDDLLLERLAQKEGRTIDILSRYLAQIITRSAANDHHALEHSLQTIISPAIAQEIADNKEKMIDALYPIMGGMISKYVTQAIKEMMEKINEKIEQGLSVERYKRKIKAKLTGVSETELLLEESSDAMLYAVFVIHKETGLLIAEAQLEESEIGDPHMVASMASAIKDFVNDWISGQEEGSSKEVQMLSYGDATLYIESAGSVYMIAFLDSEPDHEQRKEIHTFFSKIVQKHSGFFQNFEGDDSHPEVAETKSAIQQFLREKNQNIPTGRKTGKSNSARYILLALAVLSAAAAGYWVKTAYGLYRLEQDIFQQTGAAVTLEEKEGTLYLKGYLENPDLIHPIRTLLQKKHHTKIVSELFVAPEAYEKKLHAYETLLSQRLEQESAERLALQRHIATMETETASLQTRLDTAENALRQMRQEALQMKKTVKKLSQSATESGKTLKQMQAVSQVEKRAVAALKQAFAHNRMLHPDGSLDFKNKNLFEAGKSVPDEAVLKRLRRYLVRYVETLLGNPQISPYIRTITIEGYTDSSGSKKLNMELSQKRAETLKSSLLELPISQTYSLAKKVRAKGMADSNPVIVNGMEDKEASRRIRVIFEIDREKILQTLSGLAEE